MIFYHVTPAQNLDGILKEGLRPRIGERSQEIGESGPVIYLFTEYEAMNDAMLGWMADCFDDYENDMIVLEVDWNGEYQLTDGFECEATVTSTIPPQNITVYECLELDSYKL